MSAYSERPAGTKTIPGRASFSGTRVSRERVWGTTTASSGTKPGFVIRTRWGVKGRNAPSTGETPSRSHAPSGSP